MRMLRIGWTISIVLAFILAACGPTTATPTVVHTATPGSPAYTQGVHDCSTAALAIGPAPIEPAAGCDSWQANRYERPFNSIDQDEYLPHIDLERAELGQVGNWTFLRIYLHDVAPEGGDLPGIYGAEFDLDQDGRGDVQVLAMAPDEMAATAWSVMGVQLWRDSDNDVGSLTPLQPDEPDETNGYDELIFDQGQGDDPDLAWARATFDQPALVEIAFKTSALDFDAVFEWWVWADAGVGDPAAFDYHDAYLLEQAGEPFQVSEFFPADEIAAVDNSCVALWGAPPSDDPRLCVNDPDFPTPTPSGSTTPDSTPTETATVVDETGTPSPTPTPSNTPTSTWTVIIPSATLTPSNTPPPTATECINPFTGGPCVTPSPSPVPTNTPTRPPPVTSTPTVCLGPTGGPCTPTPAGVPN